MGSKVRETTLIRDKYFEIAERVLLECSEAHGNCNNCLEQDACHQITDEWANEHGTTYTNFHDFIRYMTRYIDVINRSMGVRFTAGRLVRLKD